VLGNNLVAGLGSQLPPKPIMKCRFSAPAKKVEKSSQVLDLTNKGFCCCGPKSGEVAGDLIRRNKSRVELNSAGEIDDLQFSPFLERSEEGMGAATEVNRSRPVRNGRSRQVGYVRKSSLKSFSGKIPDLAQAAKARRPKPVFQGEGWASGSWRDLFF
jgi:hypothetical protein